MSGFPRLIAAVLMLAQALVAGGMGPRAVCEDRRGQIRVDSALSPCCCHQEVDAACCDKDRGDDASPAVEQASASSDCRCVCVPVTAPPGVIESTSAKAIADHVSVDVLIVAATLSLTTWPAGASKTGSHFRTGPPGHGELDRLNSVILRL